MKRILLSILLVVPFISSQISLSADISAPKVLLEFNQASYQQGDVINVVVDVQDFTDLYGFQVDIKEDTPVFSFPGNSSSLYTVTNDHLIPNGSTWVNEVDSQVATILYTINLASDSGINYSGDNKKLVEFTLIANKDIEDPYAIFSVSNDYDDLLYNGTNMVIKLSDSLGDPILYDYVIDVNAPEVVINQTVSINEDLLTIDLTPQITVIDDYDIQPIMVTHEPFDSNTPGTYNVLITVTDIYWNSYSETIEVEVLDITIPVFNGEPEVYYTSETDLPDYLNLVSLNDNVDGDVTVTTNMVDDSSVNYDVTGDYTVNYSYTDTSGNIGTYVLVVHVVEMIHVESVSFIEESFSVSNGTTGQLTYVTNPDNAFNERVEFLSSDDSVVSIDENGNYAAHKSGTATITIRSLDTSVEDTVDITVELIVPIFHIEKSINEFHVGDTVITPSCTYTYDLEEFNCENYITPLIPTTEIGVYDAVYFANDSDGVEHTVIVKIKITEAIEPISVVNINKGIDTILLGEEWTDSGCETSCTIKNSNLDVNTKGVYKIEYEVEGVNHLPIIRYVVVYEDTPFDQSATAAILPRKEDDIYA